MWRGGCEGRKSGRNAVHVCAISKQGETGCTEERQIVGSDKKREIDKKADDRGKEETI